MTKENILFMNYAAGRELFDAVEGQNALKPVFRVEPPNVDVVHYDIEAIPHTVVVIVAVV